MAITESRRSLRSVSSCSTFSDATTLVDVEVRPTNTSHSTAQSQSGERMAAKCDSSWIRSEGKAAQYSISPITLSLVSDPSSSSQLVQLICRLFPKCTIAKKMENADKDGEKLIKEMDASEVEKRERKIQQLLAREKVMEAEFSRLGVPKDADDAKIRSAYKKLALKHHPDRNPGKEEEAGAMFKDVSRAFEVLSDADMRRRYDQFGEEGLEGGGMGGGMGGMDPSDLFSQLFGGGGGGFFGGGGGRQRPSGPRKGKDLVHRIKVSLEDLYKGKTTKLALQRHVLCAKCNGKGGKEGAVKTCHGCNGQGIKVVLRQMGPMVQQLQQTCPDCNGEGEIINAKDKCKACNGKKVTNERKVLEVNIDKGMKDGQTVTFPGEADQAPNVIPGDVVIVVEEKPHDRFKRQGDDLVMEQNIDLLTALAGGQFYIEHLDDRALLVTIHPGEIIKPDAIKVIHEQGMPAYRHHNHGQLIIKFNVDFPETLSEEAMKQLETALPARPTLPKLPKNHLVDDVVLDDIDPMRAQRAMNDDGMDEDEDGHQGQGVSCQNQ